MPTHNSQKRPELIPTYAADGRRLRDYALSAIARLLTLDLVVVERGRKGKIRCAHFRPSGGANPVHKHAHMGQHYSFERWTGWEHREMLGRQDVEALFGELTPAELEQRELFVRGVFRAVPLSVLRPQPPAPAAPRRSKVVSIASARRPSVALRRTAERIAA